MSTEPDIPILERPSFFDGQRLTAGDLSAVQGFHREMRWLHNRSLHTWGIALGLEVSGQRGDRTVTVHPGCALDCLGRELLLPEGLTIPIPPVAGNEAAGGGQDGQPPPKKYYLTASYADDAGIPPSENRVGVCEGDGAVRRPERARIRWQDPPGSDPEAVYQRGYDIILASIRVQNCRLSEPVALDERRDARPGDQPYIAAGSTPEGSTVWSFWPESGPHAGVQTLVDTSPAGFGSTPQYLAHIVGDRIVPPDAGNLAPSGVRLLDGFVDVAAATPTSFVLQLTMPRNLGGPPMIVNPDNLFVQSTLGVLESELNWYVVWVGVEG